jgi:RES domain-containing protein
VSTIAWRAVHRQYSEPPYNPFDGEGSRLQGGRWNSAGIPAVYASGSISLALLEVLVHTQDLVVLSGYVMYRIEIADNFITQIDPESLPATWQEPGTVPGLRQLGDAWLTAGSSVVLRIPSAVIPVESNFILNPRHPDFSKLVIGHRQQLPIDVRLLKK